MIKKSKFKALKSANTELINLYWDIGKFLSLKIKNSEWGTSVVNELSVFISTEDSGLKGFSNKNLWRMKQFYETYESSLNLSTLLREISWSHNLAIFSRCKTHIEREFYLRLCKEENYSFRELDRQISSSLFERTMLASSKNHLTNSSTKHKSIINKFKDRYIFEFLNLSPHYTENDLQKALVKQMKNFILEVGKDFIFVSSEYKIQVGNSDFYIDLLFYHRGLQCLIAFELKTDKFKPEYLGQLNFYLEALDRDVKKDNEKPSIGILLCKDKDYEVVEYALSRSLSPTLVSEYQTKLPDKKLLKQKLHEIFGDAEKLSVVFLFLFTAGYLLHCAKSFS